MSVSREAYPRIVSHPSLPPLEVSVEALEIAGQLFAMKTPQRRALRGALEGKVVITEQSMYELLDESENRTSAQVACIGLTVSGYVEAYHALRVGDRERVNGIAQQARDSIEAQKEQAHAASEACRQFSHSERLAMQKKIISRIIESVPASKEKILTGIGGLMGSGKTEVTPVKSNTAVSIDIDELRKELLNEYDEKNQYIIEMTMHDSWMMADRLASESVKAHRSIILQSTFHRSRWLRDRFLKDAIEKYHYAPRFFYVHRPAFDCLRRAVGFRSRPVPVDRLLDGFAGYYNVPQIVEKYEAPLTVVDFTAPSFGVMPPSNYVGKEAFVHLEEFAARRNDLVELIKVYSDIPVV